MTLKSLLVALDGSRLAESALPATRYLAERLSAKVVLLHVVERSAPEEIHGEHHLAGVREAQAYIASRAEELRRDGLVVELHVHEQPEGDLPRSLAEHVSELGTDLAVLSTHGEGGLGRSLFGSVAQQFMHHGHRPLLLIQPSSSPPDLPFTLGRILVPLDGSAAAEAALPMAELLARACDAGLHLVRVVPTVSTVSGDMAAVAAMSPGPTATMLEVQQSHAQDYLEEHLTRLRAGNIEATGEVARGGIARALASAAARVQADLVVMATHARVGIGAAVARSVAPALMRRHSGPILLVHLPAGG